MKIRSTVFGGAALLAACAGLAFGADCASQECTEHHAGVPDSLAHPDELARREIARRLLPLMPEADREAIIAAGGIGSEGMAPASRLAETPAVSPREFMRQVVSQDLMARMTDVQWRIVNGVVETLERGERPPALCFHPDTDPEYVEAVSQLMQFQTSPRYQQTDRWSRTAMDGSGLTQGTPTTLTYSFVPDGTTVPNLIGVSGSSNLHAWLNGIYGSPNNWRPLFEQVFERWSELIGTTYVYEPNDDGVTLNNNMGVVGVRGDIRIAAIYIDGNSGTLAYNNFPNDGDMVFDSGDNFFNNTGSNSLRFRNVAAHEHGHGLGMLHVCPIHQTKLMEPYVTLAFDGPQLDEILNGQRHYGDKYEPQSDDPTNAPSLGVLGIGGFFTESNVSIDDNSDQDFYAVTLTAPSRLEITLAPNAGTYQQGPQTGSCNTGATTNYSTVHDLSLAVFSSGNLITPLASANATGPGGTEVLSLDAENPGTYIIRVAGGTTNSIQRYVLGGIVTNLPFLGPRFTYEAPGTVDPGVPTPVTVTVDPRADTIVGGPTLHYRTSPGAFQSVALTSVGGNEYTGALPAANCGETVEFYFTVVGSTAGAVTLPAGGASAPFVAEVGELVVTFDDNFQTDQGWTVTGAAANAAQGRWQRAVPSGDGSRGDPSSDWDGSGMAYVTGNGGPGSNTDVDNGETILTSPALDVSGNPEAVISYARWYDNTGSGTGAAPGQDTFKVHISNDNGATWTLLETVGPNTAQSSGGWFEVSYRVANFVTPTSQVRVRFTADDLGEGSVVEAAVDAFRVSGLICDQPGGCSAADLAEPFGVLNFFDLSTYLALFNAGDPAADLAAPFGDLNFFDLSTYLNLFNQGCP